MYHSGVNKGYAGVQESGNKMRQRCYSKVLFAYYLVDGTLAYVSDRLRDSELH
jgi:hypothetical protein